MSSNERPIQSIAVKNSREHGLNAGKDAISVLIAIASVVMLPLVAIFAANNYHHQAKILAEKLLPRIRGPESPGQLSK